MGTNGLLVAPSVSERLRAGDSVGDGIAERHVPTVSCFVPYEYAKAGLCVGRFYPILFAEGLHGWHSAYRLLRLYQEESLNGNCVLSVLLAGLSANRGIFYHIHECPIDADTVLAEARIHCWAGISRY